MNTLTRRRLVAVGLAITGIAALPRMAGGQGKMRGSEIPECPQPRGVIGDWQWSAGTAAVLYARKIAILERGAYVGIDGGPDAGKIPHDFLVRTERPDTWKLKLVLAHKPATRLVTLIATGAETATGEFQSLLFKESLSNAEKHRPPGTPLPVRQRPFMIDLEITPLLEGKASPARANEIILEFREGNRTLCKFAIGASGYAEALGKAQADARAIKGMSDRGECTVEPCFLTAMCVGLVGLPDDCFELRTLRAYRDGPLRAMPGGPEIIAEYYAEAPRIVAEIARRGEGRRVLRYYLTHILPCVAFAKLGLNRLALWRYRHMMWRLQRAYALS